MMAMFSAANPANLLGWMFVMAVTGCWLIWRHAEWVKKRTARAEAEMRRVFGPGFVGEPSTSEVADEDRPILPPADTVDADTTQRFRYGDPDWGAMRRANKTEVN